MTSCLRTHNLYKDLFTTSGQWYQDLRDLRMLSQWGGQEPAPGRKILPDDLPEPV